MAKHYATRKKRTSTRARTTGNTRKKSTGSLVPLVIVMVACVALLGAILFMPNGLVPWLEPPEPMDASTTPDGTDKPGSSTTATGTTTGAPTTTTTTAAPKLDYYLDPQGMLQFMPDGWYVQADSYADGEEIPWELMLVNDWNKLPEGYEDTVEYEQVHLYYRRLDSLRVDSRMADALTAMMKAGRAAGIEDLAVQSAYRTFATQERNYWREVEEHTSTTPNEMAAQVAANQVVKRPGFSEHHLGLAVDLGGNGNFRLEEDFENTEAFAWLIEHCHEYGFILRFPKGKEDITGVIYEPWHYRYVGVEAATAIMEGGLCLEEYLQQTGQ